MAAKSRVASYWRGYGSYLERCSLACEHLLANLHFWGTNITMLNLFLVLFLEWSIVMAPLQTQSIIYYIILVYMSLLQGTTDRVLVSVSANILVLPIRKMSYHFWYW